MTTDAKLIWITAAPPVDWATPGLVVVAFPVMLLTRK